MAADTDDRAVAAEPRSPHDAGSRPARWSARLSRTLLLLLGLLVGALLLEGGTRLAVHTGLLDTPRPTPVDDDFWVADHDVLGVWHRPDATATQDTSCFRVTYRTNGDGARDRPRTALAAGRRVLMLGDSFIEGWGVGVEHRLSDLLEQRTGFEHLNFGMAHFGPYQYYLTYREFGNRYEHDAVIVGIFPENDFFDLDYRLARNSPANHYRYRPYLVGEYPDYRESYIRESGYSRLLRRNSYAYLALSQARFKLTGGTGTLPPVQYEDGLFHSFFHDATPEQTNLLRYSLERLVDEAAGRTVAVVLIPGHRDLLRYHQSGEGSLVETLREFAADRPATIVDLRPSMYQHTPNWNEYYMSCDFHWNAEGNRVAARIVHASLADSLYSPDDGAGSEIRRASR